MEQENFDIEKLCLTQGIGNYDENKACIMSAAVAKWRMNNGESLGKATDQLECVCPTVRALAIRINDATWWKDDAERTEVLRPFIDEILNTRDPELIVKRAMLCADRAVRVFAPMALDALGYKEEAAKLRSVAEIVDRATALAGRRVARDAADYASSASADSAASSADYAAASAAAASSAAADYAAASSADYAAASAAAYAAAHAAHAAYAKKTLREEAIKLLSDLCEISNKS